MNKNPFAVAPSSYTPHQPPLPPGPPPAQGGQPDYSAYWAAASTAAQAQPAVAAYNPQWPAAPQGTQVVPPRPTPEQSALYANYGYGNQHWQQRQQPQQHFQPPPPVIQPPPAPPPQPAYNPYQPQAGAYQQPYVPQMQVNPPAQVAPQTPYTPQVPSVQAYQQQPQPYYPQQPPQNRQQQNRGPMHHSSPQHLPPAKRQRFDGPNQPRGPPPPQPQFQPPPPPPLQQTPSGPIGGGVGVGFNQGPAHGRAGGMGVNQVPLGARGNFGGGGGGGRGGQMGRGRGMSMNRGGGSRGGRGGGMYGSMGGRGGGPSQGGGSFRGGFNRPFGNRDNRRGGGSFTAGGGQGPQQQHQQNYNGSFRGGRNNAGFNAPMRGPRHDASSSKENVASSSGFSSSKKDENRRTLTDFKIVGLEIQDLSWSWGTVPKASAISDVKEEPDTSSDQVPTEHVSVKEEAEHTADVEPSTVVVEGQSGSADVATKTSPVEQPAVAEHVEVKTEVPTAPSAPPPPSRIRIYFHTPVSADDSHSISAQSSVSLAPSAESSVRKGKRKKLEDDDGDFEDGRGPPPPPPQHSSLEHGESSVAPSVDMDGTETPVGRDSAAPSVAETASEGDWLMAAIGEDEADPEGADGHHMHDVAEEHLHDVDAEGEPDDYGHVYDDVEAQGEHDHTYAMDEEHHDHDAPSHDGSVPPGLDGQRDAPFDHPHLNGDGKDHHDIPTAPPAEQATPSAPALDSAESSAAPEAPSVKPADDSATTATATAPNGLSSAGDADQIHAEQIHDQNTHAVHPAPLQSSDTLSTIPDTDAHDQSFYGLSTSLIDHEQETQHADIIMEATQPTDEAAASHDAHPGLPASPSTASTTLAPASLPDAPRTNDSTTGAAEGSGGAKTPSANRLSISYASGTRRMVIDAEVVDKLKVFRADARIEIHMRVAKTEDRFAGIVFEGTSEASSAYTALTATDTADDPAVPPFAKATLPTQTVLTAYLDKDRPLSEPRWVKTGDVQDWLKSMFGRMFWAAGDAADAGWEKKIEVVDPDPAPTIWTVLEAWATNTNVGTSTERQRFLRTHMSETDNILEILLRLVRGERASYSYSSSLPVISPPSVSGPLLSALSQGSAHGAQQTHVSLAVLAMFRLAVEYAKKAVGEKGKGEVEERVGEIIRCLPSHLIYKSLDGIFKEWRVEKKGGR